MDTLVENIKLKNNSKDLGNKNELIIKVKKSNYP